MHYTVHVSTTQEKITSATKEDKAVRAASPLQPLRAFRSAAVAQLLAPRGVSQRARMVTAPCSARPPCTLDTSN
jgi:hypothetical protein